MTTTWTGAGTSERRRNRIVGALAGLLALAGVSPAALAIHFQNIQLLCDSNPAWSCADIAPPPPAGPDPQMLIPDDGQCGFAEWVDNSTGNTQLSTVPGECPPGFADQTDVAVFPPGEVYLFDQPGPPSADGLPAIVPVAPGSGPFKIFGQESTLRLDIINNPGLDARFLFNPLGAVAELFNLFLESFRVPPSGGTIFNQGHLLVSDSTIRDGFTFGHGGGIFSDTGSSLDVHDSHLLNNQCAGSGCGVAGGGDTLIKGSLFQGNGNFAPGEDEGGGGLWLFGDDTALTATIAESEFIGNVHAKGAGFWVFAAGLADVDFQITVTDTQTGRTGQANNGIRGGGIYVEGGTVTLDGSSIVGNDAAQSGGGIQVDGGMLTIANSTIAGNDGNNQGGGLFLAGSAQVSLSNVTIGDNVAASGGGLQVSGATIALVNSLIQNGPGECAGTGVFNAIGNNLASDDSCTTLFGPDNLGININDLVADPADNGGPTLTQGLLTGVAGEQAINGGDQTTCDDDDIETDQRGFFIQEPPCDIGAFEVNALPPALDFGDAPDAGDGSTTGPSYPTLLAADGARHVTNNPFRANPLLGALVDNEADGQPETQARGDDLDTGPDSTPAGDNTDDEDGVTINGPLVRGQTTTNEIEIITSNESGLLNAWIDFNANGDWQELGEQVAVDEPVSPGSPLALSFPVPDGAVPGETLARFRLSTAGALGVTGAADDGEVEDHLVEIVDPPNVVTISVNNTPFAENGGTATVRLDFARPLEADTTVSLLYTGEAQLGVDYDTGISPSGSILVPAGLDNASFDLTGLDDNIFEEAEFLTVVVAGATGNVIVGAQNEAQASITDDEARPSVSLALADNPFAENGGNATLTANLSGLTDADVEVSLTYAGTALRNDDFNAPPSVTIPAGQTAASASLTGIDDDVFEDDEDFTVTIDAVASNNADIGNPASVTATVTDDENRPTVSLAAAAGAFGENGGSTTVTAELSGPSDEDVTVTLGFTGEAALGTDYNASAQMVTIPAGQPDAGITLTGIDDNVYEDDEDLVVTIGTITNADRGAPDAVTVTVVEDEPRPAVSLTRVGSPFPENGGAAQLTATLSGPADEPVTVTLAYGGTAGLGVDYGAPANIVVAAMTLSNAANINAINDGLAEGDETVVSSIAVVSANAVIGTPNTATSIIVDDDAGGGGNALVSLSASQPPSLAEDGGTARFIATLNGTATQDITITLGLAGTADRGSDYALPDASITIPAGTDTGDVTVTGVNDLLDEPDETIIATVDSVPDGVAVNANAASAQLTVTDDDQPLPSASISSAAATVVENGGSTTVTVTLSEPAGQTVTVTPALGGAATRDGDYSLSPPTLSIAAGATSASASLTALDDTAHEADEAILIGLGTLENARPGAPAATTVIVTDNDEPMGDEPALDTAAALADAEVGAGVQQLVILTFGVRNDTGQPAVVDQVTAPIQGTAPALALIDTARLYRDSSGDGAIQDGEPLVATLTGIDASTGPLVFTLAGGLPIDSSQTIRLALVISDEVSEE
ncbi:MAG: Calx-beta domain-containing protein [Salinisphaeraceae bacterium]